MAEIMAKKQDEQKPAVLDAPVSSNPEDVPALTKNDDA
jgi:hypothetical protein